MSETFDRKSGIGASKAASVCGLSPYESALEAYFWYAGLLPDREPSEAMLWGNLLEPAIRDEVARQLKTKVEKPETIRHKSVPFMYASPDGLLDDGRGLEIKNVGPATLRQWGQPGSDDIPEHVVIQTTHQMAVAGLDAVVVAALFWGNSLKLYQVDRNEALINRVMEIEASFWDRVLRHDPPEPDFSHPSTPGLIKELYGLSGAEVELNGDAPVVLARYEQTVAACTAASKQKDALKAQLLYMMGEASAARLKDGTLLTRKQINRRGFTVEPTSYVDFRIRRPKEKHREREESESSTCEATATCDA